MNVQSRHIPAPPPEVQNVVGYIGWAVVFLGQVEGSLRRMIAMAFSDESQTVQQVFAALATDDKSTMGNLMRKLRERASLEPLFDELLRLVLEKRNLLIHRMHEIPGSNLLTPEGQAAIIKYCDELLSEASLLHEVILAVVANWLDEKGVDIGGEDAKFAKELQARHDRHLVQTFFSKEADAPARSMWKRGA